MPSSTCYDPPPSALPFPCPFTPLHPSSSTFPREYPLDTHLHPVTTMGSQKSKPETLKQKLEANPTALGDPVSLKAETADSHPTEHDTGAGRCPRGDAIQVTG